MSTDTWKHVMVYLASGYYDMEGERRVIFNEILPQLRKNCVPMRVQVHFVDIRSGLTENDWWKILEMSSFIPILNEIDRCAPFFVGLYGEKYGRFIKDYRFPESPAWNRVRAMFPAGRSLLELETFWAALKDPKKCQPLFYFRDASFLSSDKFKSDESLFCASEKSGPLTSKYPERKTDFSIGYTYRAESMEASKRMLDLKRQIIKTHGLQCVLMDYKCTYLGPVDQMPVVGDLDDFKVHLTKNLFERIISRFPPSTSAVDLLSIEDDYHKACLNEQLRFRMVGRKELLETVMEYCMDPSEDGDPDFEAPPLVMHGKAGVGLSCLVANVVDTLRDRKEFKNDLVLYHFIGASPRSRNVRTILERLCNLICRGFNFNFVVPADFVNLVTCFELLLQHSHKSRGSRLVIFLDGVDQMDADYHGEVLHWLPVKSHARIIVAMHTNSDSYQSMKRRYGSAIRDVQVPDLTVEGSREVLADRMFTAHRSLSIKQMNMLMEKVEGRRPLYLMLAASEIMVFSSKHSEVSTDKRMDNFVYQMSPTSIGLCRQTFMRWIDEFPSEVFGSLIQDLICLLACSRHGLQEDEILELIPHRDPRTFEGSGLDYPEVPLPRLMYIQCYDHIELFVRSGPRWSIRIVQFSFSAIVRAIQKTFFPDNFEASKLWVKLYSFAMARDRAKRFTSSSAANASDLVGDAMKNIGTKNLEERYHSRIAKFFRDKETNSQDARASWGGTFPRAVKELPYHLTQSRGWSRLEEVVLDLRFVEAKFRLHMGHDLLQDLVLSVQAKAPEAARTGKWGHGHKRIQDMHRFISQNFKKISSDASSTFQLAANNSSSSTLARIALRHWQDGSIRQPWFRWLNKPAEIDPLILIMEGHSAPVNRVRFSSDGLRVLSASEDSSMCLWDAFSGELIGKLFGHYLPILSCSFIPGFGGGELRGRVQSSDWTAISASRDKTMKVFDLASGQEVKQLKGHIGRVLCVAVKSIVELEQDGEVRRRLLAATGSWDRSCKIWDLDKDRIVHDMGGPDATNTCPNSAGHQNTVRDVCFSPDGSVLVTGSDDETVRLWNVQTGEEIKCFLGHDNAVMSVDYSSNGELVLSGSLDGTLKVWDTSEPGGGADSFFDKSSNSWIKVRKEILTLVGNLSGVLEGRMANDMETAVSAGKDGTVRIYSVKISQQHMLERKRGKPVEVPPTVTLFGHQGSVNTVAISPDSWRVTSAGEDGALRMWDLGGSGIPEKQGHRLACGGLSYDRYGEKLISCGHDGSIKLWDGKQGLFLREVAKKEVEYNRCSVSPDGLRAAAICRDGVLRVYDIKTGKPIITQRHSYLSCSAVCFSNGMGFNIATGSDDGTVKFWSSDDGTLKGSLDAHVLPAGANRTRKFSAVNDICYSPDNSQLVSCSSDMTVKYWLRVFDWTSDAHASEDFGQLQDDLGPEEKRRMNRKKLVNVKRREKEAMMTEDEKLARRKKQERESKAKAAKLEADLTRGLDVEESSSSDDSLLDDNDIMLIEKALDEQEEEDVTLQSRSAMPQKWKLVCTLRGHTGPVLSISFDAAGERVFSASADGTVRLWTAVFQGESPKKSESRGTSAGSEQEEDAGYGGRSQGPAGNRCLTVIDVHHGPVKSVRCTPDGAAFFLLSEGLPGAVNASRGGLLTVWDAWGCNQLGSFELIGRGLGLACNGHSPYSVACSDEEGQVYVCSYGYQEPFIPKPTRALPNPIRPSGFCSIL